MRIILEFEEIVCYLIALALAIVMVVGCTLLFEIYPVGL